MTIAFAGDVEVMFLATLDSTLMDLHILVLGFAKDVQKAMENNGELPLDLLNGGSTTGKISRIVITRN